MKIIIVSILVSMSLANASSLSSSKYGIGEERELAKATLDNSIESIKTFIKAKPEIGELGSYKSSSSRLVLWLATNDSAWSNGNALSYNVKLPTNICRPDIVKLLIADGVQPSELFGLKGSESNGHLSGAIKSSCKESFDVLLEKSNAADIASASKQVNFTSLTKIKNDATLAPNAVAIVQSLIVANQKNCKANVNAACDSEKYLRNEMSEFMDHEKSVLHSQTLTGQAEELESEICKSMAESKELQSALNDEKAKSKISGVSNLLKLKATGDQIFDAKKTIEAKSIEYKKLTKKPFNKKICN